MNILYIHGLNGSLSTEKQYILERYGNVNAPSIDYENNQESIMWLYDQVQNLKYDVIMGSSMGGFAGYHLCKLLQLPALLFNPALAERSVLQDIPNTPKTNGSCISIVLGAKDDIVNPKNTLQFLGDLISQPQDYNIKIRHDLKHRIPLDVFDEEVTLFLERLNTNN